MKWFQGTVSDAIVDSKSRCCLFVVYVEDGKDLSLRMEDDVWSCSSLCEFMDRHVILKLSAGSESLTQFSELYPVSSFPATFFINPLGGQVVDIILGFISAEELLKRANALAQKLKGNSGNADGSASAAEPAPLSKEEKIAKARSLLAAQNQKRQESLQKKEQQDEINRRQMGRNVHEFTRKQKQREAAERLKELEKERQESVKAREEIRRKIAQDRAEQTEQKEKYGGSVSPQTSAASLSTARQPSVDSDQACVQFRLPNGSSITEQFSAATTLESARHFIASKIEGQWSKFRLVCTYPRRELGLDLDSQSLAQLGLSPRAAVLVVAQNSQGDSGVVGSSGSWFVRFFMPALLLLQAVWQWFTSAFKSGPAQPSQSWQEDRRRPGQSKASRGFSSYQDGRIRRLKTDDGDDDMNTWNGNSTQQQ